MSKTLLLADDSLTIQRVVDLTFAQEDVRVVSCATGDMAVKWMEDELPDIVLADVGMPQPDGYAVAQHMKQSARLRDVPVLLLTGAFEPLDDDKARESECDGILVKPFEPQHLVARVVELLARPPVSRPEPAAEPEPVPDVPEVADVPDADGPAAPFASQAEEFAPPAPVSLHLVEPPAAPPAEEALDLSVLSTDMAELDAAIETTGRIDTVETAEPVELEPVPAKEHVHPVALFESPGVDEPLTIQWDVPIRMAAEPAVQASAEETTLEPLVPMTPLETEAWDLAAPSALIPSVAHDPSAAGGGVAAEPAAAPKSPAPAMPAVSLASAFAALLAAEQAHPGAPGGAGAPAMTEAAIEDIVRRVLMRVTDEMVRQVVLDAAERMVKAEIDKIKDSPDEQD